MKRNILGCIQRYVWVSHVGSHFFLFLLNAHLFTMYLCFMFYTSTLYCRILGVFKSCFFSPECIVASSFSFRGLLSSDTNPWSQHKFEQKKTVPAYNHFLCQSTEPTCGKLWLFSTKSDKYLAFRVQYSSNHFLWGRNVLFNVLLFYSCKPV